MPLNRFVSFDFKHQQSTFEFAHSTESTVHIRTFTFALDCRVETTKIDYFKAKHDHST